MMNSDIKSSRLSLWIARRIVDTDYYLAQNPDVAAAGVDPVVHYARHWRAAPVRAPNARLEAWIYIVSPLLASLLIVMGRGRQDITDCFRYRINQLATRQDGRIQHRLALVLARMLTTQMHRLSGPPSGYSDGGLGVICPVVRIGKDAVPWIDCRSVAASAIFTFDDPAVALSEQPRKAREIPQPELWCAQIRDASIFGFSQIVSHSAFVVYEPEADPKFRYTSRQCEFVISCFGSSGGRVLARVPSNADLFVEEAILLIGRCGANYFHFLIEYVTKGYIIDCVQIANDLPLIITDDLFPQELEVLNLIFPERKLIVRGHGKRLDVKKLHVPSLMTYIPDTPTIEFWEVAAVNYASLSWLRACVLEKFGDFSRSVRRKLYLGRSAGRNVTNAVEVEEIFRRHGFEVINPAQLSFAQQVEAFRNAHCIAGPVGAAFSNLVFAAPGTLVLGLVSPFAVQFSTFASLAEFAGCRYVAVPGEHDAFHPSTETSRQSLELTHGDYRINPHYLEKVLKVYL